MQSKKISQKKLEWKQPEKRQIRKTEEKILEFKFWKCPWNEERQTSNKVRK